MKKLFTILAIFVLMNPLFAQKSDIPKRLAEHSGKGDNSQMPEAITEPGEILYSIQLIQERAPLGIAIVDTTIIISSSDGNGSNYFDKYTMRGVHISSTVQGTSTSWGYRDLAYDGQYLLASTSTVIDKIDPNTLAVVSSITNTNSSLHRGLAYDRRENAIYSTNFRSSHCFKINASNGSLIRDVGYPDVAPYGIAFDDYSFSDAAYLWFAEPTEYGKFHLSRVDTSNCKVNFTYDFSGQLPDSSLSGGLDITINHIDYPGKIVAAAVEQYYHKLYFIDLSDAPVILPTQLEEVGEFGGYNNAGITTYGMAQYSDYLYAINNGDLWVYNISNDPANPNHITTVSIGNGNKVFVNNNLLYVTFGDNQSSFAIYQLSDPQNPQQLSTTSTTAPILDMEFYGNYLFIIQTNQAAVKVYDVSDTGNPQLYSTYNLTSAALDLNINPARKILFASYFNSDQNEGGVELIDITDLSALHKLSYVYSSNIPVRITPIDNDYFAALSNWTGDFNSTSLNCYSYSDSTNPNYVYGFLASTGNSSWDMIYYENAIYITVANEGIKSYMWDGNVKTFLKGSTLSQEVPLELTPYTKTTKSLDGYVGIYLIEMNGMGMDHRSYGSEPNKIIKVKKPEPNGKYNLTMEIFPPEAADDNCATIPSKGIHTYPLNSQLTLMAIENAANGWHFIKWEGDVSGTNRSVPITMDGDKTAKANFAKVELSVHRSHQPDNVRKYMCPCEISDSTTMNSLIYLYASEEDGWKLHKISFVASGTGNDKTDISVVKVFHEGSLIYTGTYNEDNGTIDVNFDPAITIPAGNSTDFRLKYFFNFDCSNYAYDEIKSFYVSTSGVVAEPITYSNGLIYGVAKDTVAFARISVMTDDPDHPKYYGKIQEAVDATTAGLIKVCPGVYHENINIETGKFLSLTSKAGADKTTLMPLDPTKFIVTSKDFLTIDNFTFEMENSIGHGGIKFIGRASDGYKVKNNIFNNLDSSVVIENTFKSKIEDNLFKNLSLNSVIVNKSDSALINNNTFTGNLFSNADILLNKTTASSVTHNHFITSANQDPTDGLIIQLTRSAHNDVSEHFITNNVPPGLIIINQFSAGNFIGGNLRFMINLQKDGGSNTIFDNELKGITAQYIGNDNSIRANTISGSDNYGIFINNALMSDKYKNRLEIDDNFIYGNASDGINFIRGDVIVHHNNIKDNKGVGIHIAEPKFFEIYDNKITGNFTPPNNCSAGIGIVLRLDTDNSSFVRNNYLSRNGSGIVFHDDTENNHIKVEGNTIRNNLCTNTGIHLYNSSPNIRGNSIENNNGNGIITENGSHPQVTSNNISGNSGYGFNNSNSDGNLLADGNYWGRADGPGDNGIFGNITINNWLSEPVSLVASPAEDTVYASAGHPDSTNLLLQNLVQLTDVLTLTITDSKGWVTAINNQQVSLHDSTGVNQIIHFTIPTGTGQTEISKVDYSAMSNTDSSTVNGSFYISAYHPVVSELFISNDSLTVLFGDSVQYNASAIDQYGNQINADVNWSASSGAIDTSGIFTAPNSQGEVTITAASTSKNVTATAKVFVAETAPHLQTLNILPDSVFIMPKEVTNFSVRGTNQYGYPFGIIPLWSVSGGGSIDNFGIFSADSIPGTYYVFAANRDSSLVDTAVIFIKNPTGVAVQNLQPKKYFLYQNYPNPFNPTTTIKFSIKNSSHVTLEVFDILGRRIMKPVDEVRTAGIYSEVLNFNRFASGVYFYRLTVQGKFTDVKKLLLLK
jgi:parallel beta-helix repeat protein